MDVLILATTATRLTFCKEPTNSTILYLTIFCIVGREGLEPPEPVKATDLQSVPLPITVYLPKFDQ